MGVLYARVAGEWVPITVGVGLTQPEADARYVELAGDTMTGNLAIATPAALSFGSTVRQMINLFSTTYGLGVQGSTLYARTAAGFALYRGGVHDDDPGDPGAGGSRLLYITGESMQYDGQLAVGGYGTDGTGTQPLLLTSAGSNGPIIAFFGGADVSALGTRKGYAGMLGDNGYFNVEVAGGVLRLLSGASGRVSLGVGSADMATVDANGIFFVGHTVNSDWANEQGAQMRNGQLMSHMTAASQACYVVHSSAADAAGQYFWTFRRGTGTPTQIGSITQVATTGVAYNTTSHGPWKGNVETLDGRAAVERVKAWRPISFQWKHAGGDESGDLDEDGEPCGPVERGFIAQEMVEHTPQAVTPGYGTQRDLDAWRGRQIAAEEAGEEFAEPEPFLPWQGDWAKLVPDIAAAVKWLIDTVEAQAVEIAELRAQLA